MNLPCYNLRWFLMFFMAVESVPTSFTRWKTEMLHASHWCANTTLSSYWFCNPNLSIPNWKRRKQVTFPLLNISNLGQQKGWVILTLFFVASWSYTSCLFNFLCLFTCFPGYNLRWVLKFSRPYKLFPHNHKVKNPKCFIHPFIICFPIIIPLI